MGTGLIQVYYGDGRGKTTAAVGQAIRAASQGKTVNIIQFLKGKNEEDTSFIKRLEPEIKLFCFEKSQEVYDQLTEARQSEEAMNIRNGINFARKVIQTNGCGLLILDEILGLLDNKIISMQDIRELIEHKSEEMELIFTGRSLNDELKELADCVTRMETVK
ncbi:MAG: cob(I)yrinic acid a,c-diamide adenosyltransferase [Lachnospiraceae bacterium]|nr:cob(I)yrinic acid a,c-diamide adenosyltransferase [Lachnospiraceae bacterium]